MTPGRGKFFDMMEYAEEGIRQLHELQGGDRRGAVKRAEKLQRTGKARRIAATEGETER
ncbi:MAG: hypothetical protein WCC27_05620 [Acidobacteriaceae bacterium]